jgi:hypothetical protein
MFNYAQKLQLIKYQGTLIEVEGSVPLTSLYLVPPSKAQLFLPMKMFSSFLQNKLC